MKSYLIIFLGLLCGPILVNAQKLVYAEIGFSRFQTDITPVNNGGKHFAGGIQYEMYKAWNFQFEFSFSNNKNQSDRIWTTEDSGGGLVQEVYDQLSGSSHIPNYQTSLYSIGIGVTKNFNIHKGLTISPGIGFGYTFPRIKINILDQNNIGYSSINEYDETYETLYPHASSFPFGEIYLRMSQEITEEMALGIYGRKQYTRTDHLDGITHYVPFEESYNNDRVITYGVILTYKISN